MSTPISNEDILNLISILRKAFQTSLEQREEHLLAKHIQLPKIPSVLSEAIVANLLQNKKILANLNIIDVSSNHGLADIVARTKDRVLKIEVKSTGESAFQQLGEKDIKADFLIWLHFDTFFVNNKANSFEVFVIENPSLYFKHSLKITLEKLQRIIPHLEPHLFTTEDIG